MTDVIPLRPSVTMEFPKKLIMDDYDGYFYEIDVLRALHKDIPYFLNWVSGEDTHSKFKIEDVYKVMVLTMDTSVDPHHDIDLWGVGLQVVLKSGKYFLLYLPMYNESVFDEVFSYWLEVNEHIQIVDIDTDVSTLPLMKEWRTNLYKYQQGAETFVWKTDM